jgi:hypothetical protein
MDSGRMVEIDDASQIRSLIRKRDRAVTKRETNVRAEIVQTILRLAVV